MEASTKVEPARPSTPDRAEGLPDGAPSGLSKAARGEDVSDAEEYSALDFVLGATTALEYDIVAKVETPKGLKPLTFHVRQIDDIAKLEEEHRKVGSPFAEIDMFKLNAAIVAKATIYLEDAAGNRVTPKDDAFLGGGTERIPDPAVAMETRFKYQPGILSGVAREIRTVGGWSGDRVEAAERAIRTAAGN